MAKSKKGKMKKAQRCKYCGAPISWEKDSKGKSHAVERTIYYTPDPHGNLLVLTMRGDIVRAVEDKASDRVGDIMHFPRCQAPPRYITSNKKRAIDSLPTVKAETLKPIKEEVNKEDIRTSLLI